MGWIGRAFGRALINGAVRETLYSGRQAQRQRQQRPSRRPVAKQHPGDNEAIVTYKCINGHQFTRSYYRKVDTSDETTHCPECGKQAIWKSIDVHRENLGLN